MPDLIRHPRWRAGDSPGEQHPPHTQPGCSQQQRSVQVQHVRAGGQWQAVDPTNDRAVGSAHVIVARGRDYADVPPLKGIYAGGHSEALGVSVEITQL